MPGPKPVAVDALSPFHPATQAWFRSSFERPTRAQALAWETIRRKESTLLLSPTGSGKTLAAFLFALDQLMFGVRPAESRGVRVLYISPLKALGVDVDRNLRAPLTGLSAAALRLGMPSAPVGVGVRSGDTPAEARRKLLRNPPEVLITTPESLFLMLTSQARETLSAVETVIVDEIHTMVATKRGAHLFLSLERLEALRKQRDPDAAPLLRIGLSATQRPLDEIARLLGGAEVALDSDGPPVLRPVTVVDAGSVKKLDLSVEMPVASMGVATPADALEEEEEEIEPSAATAIAHGPSRPSIWPAIHPRLVELIREHRSTMIFVNSRRLAERLAGAVNELAGEELALAHHGSVAKEQRLMIEDRLKSGTLPAIVATSSLELGIDMGAVDLVIQIEAPPSVASGMQRIGRAGHNVGDISTGIIFPKYRGDLLACAATVGRMRLGQVEESFYPRNPLDLLAQQIVAMVSVDPWHDAALFAVMRGAAPFFELPRMAFDGVLDLLSGRYPSDEFAELKPRITYDRLTGTIVARRSAGRIAILNGGTIPDRGLYSVFIASGDEATGPRVGELDEEMVFETQAGDVIVLGASSWRVTEITRDRVLVVPAPGEAGRMPFWRGDGPGRPIELGRAIGQLARELADAPREAGLERLTSEHDLAPGAAEQLLDYLEEQAQSTGVVPSDRTIVVESFLDEIGDWRVCVLTPFGARVHAPWAIAVSDALGQAASGEVDFHWSDDGMAFRLPERDEPPSLSWFFPAADQVEEIVTRKLGSTAQFAARFRENAARALLLPRRRPDRRTPLWLQRRRAADLLSVASHYPSFPILLETYRECLRDVFDVPSLVSLLRGVESRTVVCRAVTTPRASPFAATLLFNYTGNFLYEGDAPLAERRAQALSLDQAQLRALLGSVDLRSLLDPEVLAEASLELQRLSFPSARDADDIHDLLLSLGELSEAELLLRCDPEKQGAEALKQALDALATQRRVIGFGLGGERRYAAAEDAAKLRDGLGVQPPAGLPDAFLGNVQHPLVDLVSRYARTHVPFRAHEVAARFGLGVAPVIGALRTLSETGRVVEGEFLPAGGDLEWCDASVLRMLKRRSLARLRKEVEAVPGEALARMLVRWHGIGARASGLDALLDTIATLQGAPLSMSVLESEVLPARIQDYHPSMLDSLCHAGEVVWQGVEGVGGSDGRIALFLSDQFPLLARAPDAKEHTALEDAILSALAQRGAQRFDEVVLHLGAFGPDVLTALWQLVWAGLVHNDTLAPLRSLFGRASDAPRASSGAGRAEAFRSRRRERLPGSEGRWALLFRAEQPAPATATNKAMAWVKQLVERHGVLTRDALLREGMPGGFAAIYPVLKALEEAGRLRRGYFVEGLGGAQFAALGADELLREPIRDDQPELCMLSATDPANAYGAALAWPPGVLQALRPQRVAGARVLLANGRLLAHLTKKGALLSFVGADDATPSPAWELIEQLLTRISDAEPGFLIESIDGGLPMKSLLGQWMSSRGMVLTERGLLMGRRESRPHGPRR